MIEAKQIKENVAELLSRMTIEEKIGQLLQCGTSIYREQDPIRWDMVKDGKISAFLYIKCADVVNQLQKVAVEESRLGIPLIFGDDIIHGFFTNFPIPAAEACSWEPELARRTCEVSARETRANGVQWTFAPMVDVARDARWGRNGEGAGEDPFLGAAFANARVKGFQGDDISACDRVAACAKHFSGYGACMGGRDYNSVEVSPQTLFEMHLPAFKAAIDAGVSTVMSAFHDLNSLPCTGNKWLLTDVLRNTLGFKGMVVSDAGAVEQLQVHGFTEGERETAKVAMNAGIDLEMASFTYNHCMKDLVESGDISMERLDEAVSNVLTLKYKLGLFENPYINEEEAAKVSSTEESIALAREAAQKSIVLLKNNNHILPLRKDTKIALIGSLATNEKDMNGAWSGRSKIAVTIKAGLSNYDIHYACGYEEDLKTEHFEKAIAVAEQSDVIFACIGEDSEMSGEAHNRSNIEIPEIQQRLLKELKKTGRPIVTYVISGRPLALPQVMEYTDAILWSGSLGTEAGNAVADILFGDYNPSAKLVWTFPSTTGQSPTFYNHHNTGKPPIEEIWYSSKYIDAPIYPLFPFGFGLSYTSFEYTDLKINRDVLSDHDILEATITVTNTGDCEGAEIVQLYITDCFASMVRPVKELKGFEKISLNVAESKSVTFTIPTQSMGFYNQKMEYVVEPGKFIVTIGPDSAEGLTKNFVIE